MGSSRFWLKPTDEENKCISYHYENTPMQYTAILHGSKNGNVHLNYFDYFHIFAQNIDHGYTVNRDYINPADSRPMIGRFIGR